MGLGEIAHRQTAEEETIWSTDPALENTNFYEMPSLHHGGESSFQKKSGESRKKWYNKRYGREVCGASSAETNLTERSSTERMNKVRVEQIKVQSEDPRWPD